MAPEAIGPVQVDLDTLSGSPVSQSRPRGRDLESVIHTSHVCFYMAFQANIHTNTQSWKHLAFVQRGILDEPRQQLGIRAVERLPFCTLGWVPEHEPTLLVLNLSSKDYY